VESSKELFSAALVLDAGSRMALRVDGRRATGILGLMKEHTYQIALSDEEGVQNTDPITYTVRLLRMPTHCFNSVPGAECRYC